MTGSVSRRNKEVPPFSIPVHDPRENIMSVGTGSDEQKNNEKKRLKIEDCSLLRC